MVWLITDGWWPSSHNKMLKDGKWKSLRMKKQKNRQITKADSMKGNKWERWREKRRNENFFSFCLHWFIRALDSDFINFFPFFHAFLWRCLCLINRCNVSCDVNVINSSFSIRKQKYSFLFTLIFFLFAENVVSLSFDDCVLNAGRERVMQFLSSFIIEILF